jgi:pyruvate-ferredoxin/flavodoxin oxidoreductase
MGSSAKFAVKGKQTSKKDLALQAIAHGNAYVAQIAIGANDQHTVRTLLEAEAYNGPSIVIAYSHCIAHGYDMAKGAEHQVNAVKSGYWPLFRYNPRKGKGERFTLDSKEPTLAVGEFMYKENRFDVIRTSNPARAEDFLHREESEVANHWEKLLTLKGL